MSKRIGKLEFDCGSHCIYHLAVHVVFCIKFRKHILTLEKRDFLYLTLQELAKSVNCEILEISGEEDHIHFLLKYPPTATLSEVVGKLKSKSSKALLDKFGSFLYGKLKRTVWSSGFFLCSVGGATIDILKQYISNQGS